jgi:hypothetical protein
LNKETNNHSSRNKIRTSKATKEHQRNKISKIKGKNIPNKRTNCYTSANQNKHQMKKSGTKN